MTNGAPSGDGHGSAADLALVGVEAWRPVGIAPLYEVSDHGRIRSWRPMGRPAQGAFTARAAEPRYLSGYPQRYGHVLVTLRTPEGKQVQRHIHTLVLEAFVGPCPEGLECRHLDGDAGNNRLTNLRWGSRMENQKDRRFHEKEARRLVGAVRAAEPVYLTAGERNRLKALRDRCVAHGDTDGADLLASIVRRSGAVRNEAR